MTTPQVDRAHDACIDLSHYQPRVHFGRVAAAGIRLVVCKATEGTGRDASYRGRPALITGAGMRPAAYHFLRRGSRPVDQVRAFLDATQPTPGAVLAVDWEKALDGSLASIDDVLTAMVLIEEQARTTPILYSYRAVLDTVPVGHELARYPVWLASVGKGEKRPAFSRDYKIGPLPKAWAATPERILMWQYTWTGRVDGVSADGPVDCDRSFGDLDALLSSYPGSVT